MDNNTNVTNPEDKGGFLWGLLGCCIPLVGLILFLVWKDNKPKTAKSSWNWCNRRSCCFCTVLHSGNGIRTWCLCSIGYVGSVTKQADF